MIYLARHSFYDKNTGKLTPQGEARAIATSEKLKKLNINVNMLFSSPRERAIKTAKLLLPDNKIIIDERLDETSDGGWGFAEMLKDLDEHRKTTFSVTHDPSIDIIYSMLLKDWERKPSENKLQSCNIWVNGKEVLLDEYALETPRCGIHQIDMNSESVSKISADNVNGIEPR